MKVKVPEKLDGLTVKELLTLRHSIGIEIQSFYDENFAEGRTAGSSAESEWMKLNTAFDIVDKRLTVARQNEIIGPATREDILNNPVYRQRMAEQGVNLPPLGGELVLRDGNGRELRAYRGTEPMDGGDNSLSLGRAVCSMFGRTAGDEIRERRFMSEFSGEGGGYNVGPQVSARIINAARSESVLLRGGSLSIPMETAELVIVREETPPAPGWRAEGTPLPATTAAFSAVTLRPRVVGCTLAITNELAADSANLPSAIESMLAREMGLAIDFAGLSGTGNASQPRGILHTDGVLTVNSGATNPPTEQKTDPRDISRMVQAVHEANGRPNAIIGHPRVWGVLDRSQTGIGEWLPLSPMAVNLMRLQSSQMPLDFGDESNEAPIIVGDLTTCAFGIRQSLQINVSDAASFRDTGGNLRSAYSDLFIVIRCWARIDFVCLRPTHLCRLVGNFTSQLV